MTQSLKIGFLVFPEITPLDALGPAQFLARIPNAEVLTIWKNKNVIHTDAGFNIVPTTSLQDCPKLDVLCVPGGFGVDALLNDDEILNFVRSQAENAKYVTAVCTGSLLLGAAGLLNGKRATTHWAWHDRLSEFEAIAVKQRVVVDGNIITGGGVTAGIDFGLTLIEKLCGSEQAKLIQLGMEYDPKPPFSCGTPETAGEELVAVVKARLEERSSASN